MPKISLKISGNPIAKNRPRFARKGNFVKTYNNQKIQEDKFLFYLQQELKRQDFNIIEKGTPINLEVVYIMPIPKNVSKKKRHEMIFGDQHTLHIKRPDLDNLIKFTKDCMTKIVWQDDSQVAKLTATKIYGATPATHIKLWW